MGQGGLRHLRRPPTNHKGRVFDPDWDREPLGNGLFLPENHRKCGRFGRQLLGRRVSSESAAESFRNARGSGAHWEMLSPLFAWVWEGARTYLSASSLRS